MAFQRSGLCRVGGSGTGGSTWQYSTADATSAVVAAGYFSQVADIYAVPPVENALGELNAGDVLLIVGTTGTTPTARISYVESNNGTAIACAAGTVITA